MPAAVEGLYVKQPMNREIPPEKSYRRERERERESREASKGVCESTPGVLRQLPGHRIAFTPFLRAQI